MTKNQTRPLYPQCIIPSLSIINTYKAPKRNRKGVRKLFLNIERFSWLRNLQCLTVVIAILSLPNMCLSNSPVNFDLNNNYGIIESQIIYHNESKKLDYLHLCQTDYFGLVSKSRIKPHIRLYSDWIESILMKYACLVGPIESVS